MANKVDDDQPRGRRSGSSLSLGLGDPCPVSAPCTAGAPATSSTTLVAGLPGPRPSDDADAEDADGRRRTTTASSAVAIVGRPNVGKSTLFNRLIGDERAVVHDMPGTTRDTIDTVVETDDGPVRFVDTAGMRRRAKIDEGTEYYSLVRALRAVDEADVALLVIDATEGSPTRTSGWPSGSTPPAARSSSLLNKWELLDAEERADVTRPGRPTGCTSSATSPVLKISALTGKGVHKLLPGAGRHHRRLPPPGADPEGQRRASGRPRPRHPAPDGARVLYATQGATDPPTFTLFANRELPRTYLRYLERQLREAFDLGADAAQAAGPAASS